METEGTGRRSTKKKDNAPRGVFKHRSGVWAIRYVCGAGCKNPHAERVGPSKSEAIKTYHARKARVASEPGWCPVAEREKVREAAVSRRAEDAKRLTFAQYATDYLAWCEQPDSQGRPRMRSCRTIKSEFTRLLPVFGAMSLDRISTADVETFLGDLLAEVSQATVNRYRDRLSGAFKRAVRLKLVSSNPVTPIPKFRESGGRIVCLTETQEAAIRDALASQMRPYFDFSLHTGFRWSKQMGLRWIDVDVLTKVLTIGKDKNGQALRVPFNSVVERVLFDMGAGRSRPNDPGETVFPRRYREPDKFFPRAVKRAQETLREAGQHDEAARLEGVSWHGLRHTWASRLTMAGVDPRTLQTLGNWRSLGMVERYSHMAPAHLRAAVERLVAGPTLTPLVVPAPSTELDRNLIPRQDGASLAS